jgi:hypothetical protein
MSIPLLPLSLVLLKEFSKCGSEISLGLTAGMKYCLRLRRSFCRNLSIFKGEKKKSKKCERKGEAVVMGIIFPLLLLSSCCHFFFIHSFSLLLYTNDIALWEFGSRCGRRRRSVTNKMHIEGATVMNEKCKLCLLK